MYEKVMVKRRNPAHFCECGNKALVSFKGRVWRWRPDHPLCKRCWSTLVTSLKRKPSIRLRSSLPQSLATLGHEGLVASVTPIVAANRDRDGGLRRRRGDGGVWERRLAWELAQELGLAWAS